MVVFYFSGTGNTRYLAKKFGQIIKCDVYSIEEKVNFKKLIKDNDTIALCYPIHFSTAPILFKSFLKHYKKDFVGKKIISLCSQQFFSGDGGRSIVDLLDDVKVIYVEHFNMQNNITSMPLYYKMTKINNEKCLKKVDKKLEKIVWNIKSGKVKLKGFNKFSILMGKSQYQSPKKIRQKQKEAVKINDNCILCNQCVKVCPTKNLEKKGNEIASKEQCTFCMRCVNICPSKSITVCIHGKVKEQYYLGDI